MNEMNNMTNQATASAQVAAAATVEVPSEVQVINAKADAAFMMTPAGQTLRQFELLQRMGRMYATATVVPDTYKNNLGNCAIALDMAQRMGVNPLMVMQNLYIVHGMPSFSTKFLISCINASGRFTPLRYEFRGKEGSDDYGCRCYAFEAQDREHKEPLYGEWITWGMVKKEGWSAKNGSKWLSMAGQMFRYRAAAFWQRIYCPEISMGFITSEEVLDGAALEVRDDVLPTTTAAASTSASAAPKSLLAVARAADAVNVPTATAAEAKRSSHDLAEEIHAKWRAEKGAADGATQMMIDPATGEILTTQSNEQ